MADSKAETVKAFLNVFHGEAAPEPTDLARYMQQDAEYWSLVPAAPTLSGVDAISAGVKRQFETYRDCHCEIHAIAEQGDFVFTERTDHVVLNSDDRTVSARICAVFEFGTDGRIASWREYWDSHEVTQQMGVDQADLKEDLAG